MDSALAPFFLKNLAPKIFWDYATFYKLQLKLNSNPRPLVPLQTRRGWSILSALSYNSLSYSFFQISDIVVGQEDVSAKEALLRWAQKTTHRYPGVKVDNFTGSWRDGLAFNAIIHRNRPDLVDWKTIDKRQVRERIDLAFHVMEKEYGVTRLLDPEGRTCFIILVQFGRTHPANLGVQSGSVRHSYTESGQALRNLV